LLAPALVILLAVLFQQLAKRPLPVQSSNGWTRALPVPVRRWWQAVQQRLALRHTGRHI